MKMLSQTLSIVGMLAVAAVIAFAVQGFGSGVFAWGRLLLVAALAALCFWGAARVKARER